MRRWLTVAAVVAIATAALLGSGYLLLMHAVLTHDSAAAARGRARAEQRAATTARTFADSVLANSSDAAGPPDETLDRLRPYGLRIRATTRQPELVMVVASSASYAEMYGAGSLTRCFAIRYHGLGTTGARYDLVARDCPT